MLFGMQMGRRDRKTKDPHTMRKPMPNAKLQSMHGSNAATYASPIHGNACKIGVTAPLHYRYRSMEVCHAIAIQ